MNVVCMDRFISKLVKSAFHMDEWAQRMPQKSDLKGAEICLAKKNITKASERWQHLWEWLINNLVHFLKKEETFKRSNIQKPRKTTKADD